MSRFPCCMWLVERKDGTKTPCHAIEQFQVCLDVRSSRDAPYYRVVTPFKICTHHKRAVTLDVMLDGGGWANIRQRFRRLGKKEPRRRLTTLALERIEDLEAKRNSRTSASGRNTCKAS